MIELKWWLLYKRNCTSLNFQNKLKYLEWSSRWQLKFPTSLSHKIVNETIHDLPLQSISLIRWRAWNLQRYSLALLQREVRKFSLQPDFEHASRCAKANAVKCLFICDEFFLESSDSFRSIFGLFLFHAESAPVWSWPLRSQRRGFWSLNLAICLQTWHPFRSTLWPALNSKNDLIFNFFLFSSCFCFLAIKVELNRRR